MMLKYLFLLQILLLGALGMKGQTFECNDDFYIVVNLSPKTTKFYRVVKNGERFDYELITTITDRWLTALSYHVLDEYIYAIDYDTYEIIRLYADGSHEVLQVPENLGSEYKIHSGMIFPDGSVFNFFGYDENSGMDIRFYSLNLERDNYYAGYFGVVSEQNVAIQDMAVDPIRGVTFGYDNLLEKLVNVEIGGTVSTYVNQNERQGKMNALFFDKQGQLYAFSAERGMYEVNKLDGTTKYISDGPQGLDADGCSCPYSFQFEKTIVPELIVPCEPFTVNYRYQNFLGIGQPWVSLRDTFPDGFRIIDVEGSIIRESNFIDSEPHILSLDNLIYLLGENEITLTVESSPDFMGSFQSSAVHWDFPTAFGYYQYSDDPNQPGPQDDTYAEVLDPTEMELEVSFNCSKDVAFIKAPIPAHSYEWSTGSKDSVLVVTAPGVFDVEAVGECIFFTGSIEIASFPEPSQIEVEGPGSIELGDRVNLMVSLSQGNIEEVQWQAGEDIYECKKCREWDHQPLSSTTYNVMVIDEDGCEYRSSKYVEVKQRIDVYTPNAFSPNGDGMNDKFVVSSSLGGTVDRFAVYDRWGGAIFSQSDFGLDQNTLCWDGKSGNQKIGTGMYVWIMEVTFINGTKQILKGQVLLLND